MTVTAKRKTKKLESPAYQLLKHVWDNEGYKMDRSWARLNGAMQDALSLAISSQMRFELEDFQRISGDFRIGYWGGADGEHMLAERYYSLACKVSNMSACLSFEHWKGRKPFLVLRSEREDVKVRVHLGATFQWPDWKAKKMLTVHCTSFSSDGTSFGAVERESVKAKSGNYWREKVKRRFSINHEQIAEYHAKLRELRKPTTDDAERAEAT